jgi:translation initiation factor 2 subunit 3
LEYENRTGFVGLKEITQAKWLRNLKKIANEGDVEVMEVISISDRDVDLTRRYISDKAKEHTMSRYKRWKRVYDYLVHMVSDEHRDYIVDEIIHPYLSSVGDENFSPSGIDREENDNCGVNADVEETPGNMTRWLEGKLPDISDPALPDILSHIVKLVERPTESKIQSGTVQFKKLFRSRVGQLNRILQTLREKHRVHIRTVNTRTGTFQVISKEKTTAKAFDDVLQNMLNDLSSVTVADDDDNDTTKEDTMDTTMGENETRRPSVNIGIVGHVAHGKTTLIEAISGVDTRKYKKEITTNRTWNIGYTNATVCKCVCNWVPMYVSEKDVSQGCECDRVTVSIVDCPGHNVLLSTMITGAQIMDTCVLVVSADEPCPRPQTTEHVAVLQIIGHTVSRSLTGGLLLQNKVDLVTESRARESRDEMAQFAKGTMFEGLEVVPISAQMKINMEAVIRYIYEYAKRTENRRGSENRLNKGIIVRTFDINKPGSDKVKGAVVGGSIMTGEFSIGDRILILPLAIKATVLSIETERKHLSTARPGGLVGIQTDINPTYCPVLVGCTFIEEKEYDPDRLLSPNAVFRFKYVLLNECNLKRLNKDDQVTINYSGGNMDATVVKSSKDRHRGSLRLSKPMYVFPDIPTAFTMVRDKRLIGFGWSLDHLPLTTVDDDRVQDLVRDITFDPYDESLRKFYERLQEWKETSMSKFRIPVPKALYRNTFTTIVNFGSIADVLNVSTDELGSYVYHELGCKSWSINGQRQLILKGRTDERKVMSVLHNFITETRCMLCRNNSVKTIRNMGVKQRVCTKCSWKA